MPKTEQIKPTITVVEMENQREKNKYLVNDKGCKLDKTFIPLI